MPFASSIALSKVVTSSICPSRYRLEAAAAYRLSSAMPVGMFRLSVCAAPSLTFQRSSSRCTLLFCAPSLRTSSPAVSCRAAGSACCAKAPSPRELSSECETAGVSTVSPVFSTLFPLTSPARCDTVVSAEVTALNVPDVSLGSATASIEGCRAFAISFSGTPTEDKYSDTIKFRLFFVSQTASTTMWEPSIFFSKITMGAFLRFPV